MKFTINRAVFIEHLNNVQRAISTKTTIPVLTGVKIAVTNSSIILTGSDTTLSIEIVIDANDEKNGLSIEETGSIVITARFFGDIVRKLPEDTFTLEVNDSLQATIRSGESVFNLMGTAGSEYPRLPEIDNDYTFNIPADLFKRVVNYTIVSVSNQEIRPIFTGIHFEIGHDQLKAVATDSHRLSQRIVPLESPAALKDDNFVVNIPGRSLMELTRIIADDETIEMMVTDNQVLFKNGSTYLYSRLLEGDYPNTNNLLPRDHQTAITLPANEFLGAIERALILSHQSKSNVVRLNISSDQVILNSRSSEVGNVTEKLEVTSQEGEELNIAFNPDYMRQALRTFGSQEVVIRFQNAGTPFILLPVEEQDTFNRLQLITPVRTLSAR
ncbi:MAG: DNA polymerase III subunit beta [Aerococcus sp.]|nr:DNA polymerase III subunit beta [Aerococcus sp.]